MQSSGSKFELDLCPKNNKGSSSDHGQHMCEVSEMGFLMQNPLCLQSPDITRISHNFF